ncbi:unnamed protein product [Sphagnum balticum]
MPSSDRCIRAVRLVSISHLTMEKLDSTEVVLANTVAMPPQKEHRCSYQPEAQPQASLNVVMTPWLSMAAHRTLSVLYTFSKANNQHHGIRHDLSDDRLLGVHFEELITRLGKRALVFNMCNNLVDVDAHQFKNHVVHRHGKSVSDRLFDLDVEHGDEQPNQCLDMCIMLHEQQRPPLQEGERDVDQVDGGRDRVGDNPPLVRQQNLKIVLLGVVDQLASILLVKCEHVPEVDPTVGLLWAFHVHANDEDVLHAQIDRERVGELDLAAAADALD